jgi:hypothetical protein
MSTEERFDQIRECRRQLDVIRGHLAETKVLQRLLLEGRETGRTGNAEAARNAQIIEADLTKLECDRVSLFSQIGTLERDILASN